MARAAQAAAWSRLAGAWDSLRLRPTSTESAGNRPGPGRSGTAAPVSAMWPDSNHTPLTPTTLAPACATAPNPSHLRLWLCCGEGRGRSDMVARFQSMFSRFSTTCRGKHAGSDLGQLAVRRPLPAPEPALGCPRLRPTSANQQRGWQWHPGAISLGLLSASAPCLLHHEVAARGLEEGVARTEHDRPRLGQAYDRRHRA